VEKLSEKEKTERKRLRN